MDKDFEQLTKQINAFNDYFVGKDQSLIQRTTDKLNEMDFRSYLSKHLGSETVEAAEKNGDHHPSISFILQNAIPYERESSSSVVVLPTSIADSENPNRELWKRWKRDWNTLHSTYKDEWTKKQSSEHKKWLSHMNMYVCYWDCVADLGHEVSNLMQSVTYKYCGRDKESRCGVGANPTADSYWNKDAGVQTTSLLQETRVNHQQLISQFKDQPPTTWSWLQSLIDLYKAGASPTCGNIF